MNKVGLRTMGLAQALTSLGMAGCKEVTISLVPNAVKMEGTKEDGEVLTLHVWSKEAEETAGDVGKGRKLEEEECKWLDKGKCPICEDHKQLFKRQKSGLAINVSCDEGHLFWVPPPPLEPEYLGRQEEVKEEVEEAVEEAVKQLEEEKEEAGESLEVPEEGEK